jgi:hypothetical protein
LRVQAGIGNAGIMEDGKCDEWDDATDQAIGVCGGDARGAVKALLIANAFLKDELAMTTPVVSYGYRKGWHARKGERGA